MKYTLSIVALISLLGLGTRAVEGQTRGRRRPSNTTSRLQQSMSRSLHTSLSSNLYRGRLTGTGSGRATGLTTRAEKIRRQLSAQFPSNPNGFSGLLEPPPPVYSPITRMLNERNLLRSRSYLAVRSASLMGRQDYIYDKGDQGQDAVSRFENSQLTAKDTEQSPRQVINFPDLLTGRLNEKADDYYTLGLGYFREKKYLRAKHYFDQVRQLEPDGTRAYVADVIVSFQRRDLNMAFMYLNRAMERTEKLSDLQIDTRAFFPSKKDFQQVVDIANLMANTIVDSPSAHLLLAYYAWLNGDLNTAINAAQLADQKFDGSAQNVSNGGNLRNPDQQQHTGPAQRFYELLIDARDNPAKKAIGD